MLTFNVTVLLTTRRAFTSDELDDFVETAIERLHGQAIDPWIGTSRAGPDVIVEAEVTIDSDDVESALATAMALIRDSLHAAMTGGTPEKLRFTSGHWRELVS